MTYSHTIAQWSGMDVDAVARMEVEADARHIPTMHDTRVDVLVRAAFDGFGDVTGSDDYGYSAAWIDLSDIGDYGAIIRDNAADLPALVTDDDMGGSLAAYLATWRNMGGCRYAIVYMEADGSRDAIGYATDSDMRAAFDAMDTEYCTWEESAY